MNYSNIYNIDFRKLANMLTPPFLRKLTHIDWLETLFKPLEEVNFKFKIFRKESIYKVTHNGQVVYLQKVLNDAFDNEFRRIYIVDSFAIEPLWVYPEANQRDIYIGEVGDSETVYVYDESIFDDSDVDFIVVMPIELMPATDYDLNIVEIQIKSLVNYYKLASKRYKIIWI